MSNVWASEAMFYCDLHCFISFIYFYLCYLELSNCEFLFVCLFLNCGIRVTQKFLFVLFCAFITSSKVILHLYGAGVTSSHRLFPKSIRLR